MAEEVIVDEEVTAAEAVEDMTGAEVLLVVRLQVVVGRRRAVLETEADTVAEEAGTEVEVATVEVTVVVGAAIAVDFEEEGAVGEEANREGE